MAITVITVLYLIVGGMFALIIWALSDMQSNFGTAFGYPSPAIKFIEIILPALLWPLTLLFFMVVIAVEAIRNWGE